MSGLLDLLVRQLFQMMDEDLFCSKLLVVILHSVGPSSGQSFPTRLLFPIPSRPPSPFFFPHNARSTPERTPSEHPPLYRPAILG